MVVVPTAEGERGYSWDEEGIGLEIESGVKRD